MPKSLRSMIQDETGAAALEYGLLVFAVAALALISVETFGRSVSWLFSQGPAVATPWGR